MIRLAKKNDIAETAKIYNDLLTYEAETVSSSNWVLNLYPTIETAEEAFNNGCLYVLEREGRLCGSVILNKEQSEDYETINWNYPADKDNVMVIHTLCIHPDHAGSGCATELIKFAEALAKDIGCRVIRLDTWAENKPASALYLKNGFSYAGAGHIMLHGLIPEDQIYFEKRIAEA